MVESFRYPMNTEPKLPPPNLFEKFLVARCRSVYRNAVIPIPSSGFSCVQANHFPLLFQTISRRIIKNKTPMLAPMATPIIFPLIFLCEFCNSFAASRM
ncbi:Os04g0420700 [Oryza sativa Japonica Group]|uniref:Os04g0420700 protein n=1 Tax=Oryza sativa subsp. japonica TaxID=39947 RepID=A0A0P0WA20_ORYSJ|nr:Os04g0420700 [Oryza sativa Japonica Group]